VEGQTVAIEYRYAEGKFERFPDLAAGLVGLGVDVIVTGGGPASLAAARNATSTIPIVMAAASSDPVGQGLIATFARPGGNITGLAAAPRELWSKRLEFLKEAVPRVSRVAVLWDANVGPSGLPREAEEAARVLRLQLLPFEVRTADDFQGAVEAAVKEKAEALYVTSTPLFSGTRRARLIELVTKHRLPTISMWRDFAEAGGLMTYGPIGLHEQFRRAATYVHRILKGAKPADLPVEQPTKYELVVNLKTARALGLTIPPSVLLQADEVIQ
jgi:putative ABC transport system substrate-binding protein